MPTVALSAEQFGQRLVAIQQMQRGLATMIDALIEDLYVPEREASADAAAARAKSFLDDVETMGQPIDPEDQDAIEALVRQRIAGAP